MIFDYFEIENNRYFYKDLFRKQEPDGLKQVDKLEQHISYGDYGYIYSIKDPSIVASFFKSVLKYMEEPLCTYKHYEGFKNIC